MEAHIYVSKVFKYNFLYNKLLLEFTKTEFRNTITEYIWKNMCLNQVFSFESYFSYLLTKIVYFIK